MATAVEGLPRLAKSALIKLLDGPLSTSKTATHRASESDSTLRMS